MGSLTHCPDCGKMCVGEARSFCSFCLETFRNADVRFFSTKKDDVIVNNHSPLHF